MGAAATPLKNVRSSVSSVAGYVLNSTLCWWCISLASALIVTFNTRYLMNPDGISYLDLASAALAGGPGKLVNAHWSPGYPALIGIALFLFRPSPGREFPLIHGLNFVIFAFASWAFSMFYGYWSGLGRAARRPDEGSLRLLKPFAFATFLWFTLSFTGPGLVTPDLGVAAIIFLAAGITCRLAQAESSWKEYAVLGLVLGAGYYVKAAVLPLGIALLLILALTLPASAGLTRRKRYLHIAVAFLVLLLVAAPLIAAISVKVHRITIGEAGWLNYIWHANGLQWTNGTGAPEQYFLNTTPDHPAPKLAMHPVTLVFASPIGGTYPLWYDPFYWYSSVKARFDLPKLLVALRVSLGIFKDILFAGLPFVAGAIVLLWFSLNATARPILPRTSWWQLAWPVSACIMYSLLYVEIRYLAPLLVLLCLAVYRVLMPLVDRRAAAAACATAALVFMVPFAVQMAVQGARVAEDLVRPRAPEYQIEGLGLRKLGLRPGDRLAVVGYAHNCFYARFDRLRIIAQIPDADEFWHLGSADMKTLAERLHSIGVKAVVAFNGPEPASTPSWREVTISPWTHMDVMLVSPEIARNSPR